MLSRAFANASSSSLTNSSNQIHLIRSLSSTQLSESNDEYEQDDSIHGSNVDLEQRTGSEDFLDVFDAAGDMEGLPATSAMCSTRSAAAAAFPEAADSVRLPYQSVLASSASEHSRPPLCRSTSNTNDNSYYSSSMAIPLRQSSNPFPQLARSCPKPIAMPRKVRQGSLPQDQDELQVFIPPHELAATSLMDPSYVAESLSRKGSAALRLRSAALRKTGFYDGHTETLRISSSFKP